MILKLFYPILHYLFQTNSCLLSNIIFKISVLARTGHYMIFINSIYGKKINIYIYKLSKKNKYNHGKILRFVRIYNKCPNKS
jgi:hypothetical protein